MMFAPAAWQFIKIPIVIVSVALLILYYLREIRKELNILLIIWFAVLLSYGIIWSFIGELNSNPGVSDLFRLNVIWVVLYALYVFYIDTTDKFKSLVKTMVWATIAISLYNIAIALSAIDIIPNVNSFLAVDDELTNTIGFYQNFITLQSNNIGSLVFLAPFVLALYVTNSSYFFGLSKRILAVSVLLAIITVLISGRRALWLEMIVTPFLLFLFNLHNVDKSSIKPTRSIIKFYLVTFLLLIATGLLLTNYFGWDVNLFKDRFTNAFESGVRQEQAAALFKGFIESPLIGSGFGIGVEDVVRSYERPWTYELTYMLMLYNTGILGSTLYIICCGIIYLCLIRFIKNGLHDNAITSSLLNAFTCFIIANSTNPYFGTYDYMWMLYFPMAYINVVQTESGKDKLRKNMIRLS